MQTLGIPTTTLEEELAAWLDEQPETPCEYEHKPGTSVCSVKVEYRGTDCRMSLLLCKSAADRIAWSIKWMECRKCRRPARLCWKVVPV